MTHTVTRPCPVPGCDYDLSYIMPDTPPHPSPQEVVDQWAVEMIGAVTQASQEQLSHLEHAHFPRGDQSKPVVHHLYDPDGQLALEFGHTVVAVALFHGNGQFETATAQAVTRPILAAMLAGASQSVGAGLAISVEDVKAGKRAPNPDGS